VTAGRPRIVVTQGEGAAGSLATSLAALGADVFALPTIAIEPPADWGPLDDALAGFKGFDWIVFTSRHAVEAVTGRPGWAAACGREPLRPRVAAVGQATAKALTRSGVTADLVPEEAGGAPLAALLALDRRAGTTGELESAARPGSAPAATTGVPTVPGSRTSPPLGGVRVLWPRSDIARRELPDALRAAGAEVIEPVAYRTVLPAGSKAEELARTLLEGGVDAVAFLSPSSACNFAAMLGWGDLRPLSRCAAVASIGPTTSEALRELGAAPDIESAARTAEDLARTLVAYLERQ
jgi:uroporphyrinogen-III synthase